MPSSRDGLVGVGGNHHARQRTREVALEVRQNQAVIIGGRQKVVCIRRKPYTPNITAVNLELLD